MIVGVFLLAGFASFAWIAVKMGDLDLFKEESYDVTASFTSISGLKEGAALELAGVVVGKVTKIELNEEEYEATVFMNVVKTVQL